MTPDWSNVEIAIGTAAAMLLVFAVMSFAQRRSPVAAGAAVATTGSHIVSSAASVQDVSNEVKAVKGVVDDLKLRVIEAEHNVAQVRTMVGALPSKDAVHKLETEIADLRGDLKVVASTTLATGRTTERIEKFLMERGS